MKKIYLIALAAVFSITVGTAGAGTTTVTEGSDAAGPWIPLAEGERILTMQDVPLGLMQREPEKYLGTVFEDRFKFYHIYRNREDAIPVLSKQTIVGKTYFTARPIMQATHVIKIQITPAQDEWIRRNNVRRQDILKARVRFAGFAPGNTLAFDLLEIEETARSWLLRHPGE